MDDRAICWGRLLGQAVILLLVFCSPSWGGDEKQTSAIDGVRAEQEKLIAEQATLPILVAYTYRENPSIKAAKAEWRAAVEKYRVDTALDDPEVMLEEMYMTERYTDPASPDDWKVTLTQSLPLPGRLATAGRVAGSDASLARLRVDSTVRDTILRLRESYQEMLYLRAAIKLAAANQGLLEQLRKAGETETKDRAALVDVMKAQAQSGQLQYDFLLLQDLERTERTRLNAILNRPPDAPIGNLADDPVRPLVYSLEEIYPLAESNLEEIRMAQASLDKAKAMATLARYETLPQVTLGVAYGEISQVEQVTVQAGLSLPIWIGKNGGRLGAAQAEVEKTAALRTSQINETRGAIRDIYFRAQNSERLVLLYRDDLVPQANRAMQTAETWFKGGQGSLTDYAETASAWYNFHLALARAKADYGKFLARLESLAGQSLTERKAGAKAPEAAGASK